MVKEKEKIELINNKKIEEKNKFIQDNSEVISRLREAKSNLEADLNVNFY